MTTIAPEAPVAAEWRRLGRFLWTGRRDDRPVGMIEQGRWFVLTDEHGEPAGRYRSLADAQAAAVDPALRTPLAVGAGSSIRSAAVVASASLGGGIVLGTAALTALHLV